mgnify:FL=1
MLITSPLESLVFTKFNPVPPPPGVFAYNLTPVLYFGGSDTMFSIIIESSILTEPVPGAIKFKFWFEFNPLIVSSSILTLPISVVPL